MRSDTELRRFVARIAHREIAAAVSRAIDRIGSVGLRLHRFVEDRKREKIDGFLRENASRLYPVEVDPASGLPTLRQQLLALDDTRIVHKFSEGRGKPVVPMTALDVELATIARRPAQRPGAVDEGAALERVRRFAEDHAAELAKVGATKKEFLETYRGATPEQRRQILADLSQAG